MLKPALAAFVALSGLNAVAAQTAPPKVPQPGCALPSVADSVALNDVPDSDLVTVPVEINGKPRAFLLDIGSNATEVSEATVKDLALPDVKNAPSDYMNLSPGVDRGKELTAHADFTNNLTVQAAFFDVKGASSGDNYRPHVRIGSFAIGSATGHDLAFAVAKDADMGKVKSKPYDGLMTGDFFKQYDVELDFVRNKLSYLTPASCTDPDQVVYWPHSAVAIIPMTDLNGKIQVEVAIQGHSIPAVIDTSSPHTVMRRDIAELMLDLKAGSPAMVPDGDTRDGTGLQVYRHTFSQISFAGGVTAYNVPALIQTSSMVRDPNRRPILGSRAQFSTGPELPALTLGMDVLHQLHLYIVYGQKNLYVTAAE